MGGMNIINKVLDSTLEFSVNMVLSAHKLKEKMAEDSCIGNSKVQLVRECSDDEYVEVKQNRKTMCDDNVLGLSYREQCFQKI